MIKVALRVRFTFYVYYVFAKPTSFSSCITVTLKRVADWGLWSGWHRLINAKLLYHTNIFIFCGYVSCCQVLPFFSLLF